MKLIKSALLILFSLFIQQTWACSCMQPPVVEKALEQSAAVFTGTVISIEPNTISDTKDKPEFYFTSKIVTIQLEKTYKTADGVKTTAETIEVRTASDGAACGYYFQKGEKYIVYAHQNSEDGKLWTNICSRTKRYTNKESTALDKATCE